MYTIVGSKSQCKYYCIIVCFRFSCMCPVFILLGRQLNTLWDLNHTIAWEDPFHWGPNFK